MNARLFVGTKNWEKFVDVEFPGVHQQQQIVLLYNSRKVVRMEAEYDEEKTHVDLKVLEVEAQFDSTGFW